MQCERVFCQVENHLYPCRLELKFCFGNRIERKSGLSSCLCHKLSACGSDFDIHFQLFAGVLALAFFQLFGGEGDVLFVGFGSDAKNCVHQVGSVRKRTVGAKNDGFVVNLYHHRSKTVNAARVSKTLVITVIHWKQSASPIVLEILHLFKNSVAKVAGSERVEEFQEVARSGVHCACTQNRRRVKLFQPFARNAKRLRKSLVRIDWSGANARVRQLQRFDNLFAE